MHYSTILATVSLATLSLAAPAPVQTPACGQSLAPEISRYLQQAKPDGSRKNNDSGFNVSQTVDANGHITRINHALSFEDIPAGATACQLYVNFPDNFYINSTAHAVLSVKTLYKDSTDTTYDIREQAHWTWDSFYTGSTLNSAVGTGIFGTITLKAGQHAVINSESCPVGGGNLAFIFEISEDVKTTESVSFYIGDDFYKTAGFRLSYELNGC